MTTTTPSFQACEDPLYVMVRAADGSQRRIPQHMALRLFLATHQRKQSGGGGGAVVALSFLCPHHQAQPQQQQPDYYVWLSESSTDDVDWPSPEWMSGFVQPTAVPIEIGAWVALPDPEKGDPKPILHASHRRRALREQQIATGIEDRCRAVSSHGTSENFVDSLDYYTTQRVKLAFQRVNLDGLQKRLDDVRDCQRRLLACLQSAPAVLAEAFVPPVPPEEDTQVVDRADCEDPNALCVPLWKDYWLDLTAC